MATTGRRGHVSIQRHWLTNPDMQQSAGWLMLWLDSHTDAFLADVTVSFAADALGWSRNRVKRATSTLERYGLITTTQHPRPGGGTRTEYTLHQSVWTEQTGPIPHVNGGPQRTTSDGPQQTIAVVHHEPRAVVHDETPSTSKHKGKESTLRIAPDGARALAVVAELPAGTDVLFDRFWDNFPRRRRVNKPGARKAFEKALKKADVSTISDGFHRWQEYYRLEPEFAPQPTTWLNQERWNDDPPARLSGGKSAPGMNRLRERLAGNDR